MSKSIGFYNGLRAQIERYHPNIRDVVLYVNSRCNLRCKHCYIGNALLNENNSFLTDDLCAFISEFRSLDRMTILGGEPLLHRGINRILQAALSSQIGERRLTTNLTDFFFLDRLKLSGRLITFAVSLDGSSVSAHDEIRGQGSFEKTVRNVSILLNEGFDVEISHTVSAKNIDDFEQLVAKCRSLGVKKLNLHKVSLQGNAADYSELGLSSSRWIEFCRQLEKITKREAVNQYSIRIRYPPMYISLAQFNRMVENNEYWAHSSGSYYASDNGQRIVLYPNGRVYVSSELFDTESHLGDIRDGTFHINESSSNEIKFQEKSDPLLLAKLGRSVPSDSEGNAILSVSFKRSGYI